MSRSPMVSHPSSPVTRRCHIIDNRHSMQVSKNTVSKNTAADFHRDDRLDASIRYDAVVDAAVSLAGAMKYRTLEALGEAIAIGLLRRFALIDTICVGVSKFSPPIPHTSRLSDRDGERVITKVVARTRNHRYRHSLVVTV